MNTEQSLQIPKCDLCDKPAVGFIREVVERMPKSLEEQYSGIRLFAPGDKSFRCSDHFPK